MDIFGQKGTFIRASENLFETSFEPDSLTDAWFWFDANDNSTLFQDLAGTVPATTNGDVIALWKDKSVNGLDVSQTVVADRPVLAQGAFNGNDVVDFDATDWFERILGANYSGDFTLFIVLKSQDPAPPNFESFYSSHNTPTVTGSFQIDYNSGTTNFQVRSKFGGGNVFTVFDVFADNIVKLFGVTFNSTSGVMETYDNGVLKDSDVSSDIFHSRIRINSNRNSNRHHNGQIAEVFAYKKILSPCENGEVIAYLNKKYATAFANKPTPGGIGCDENILWLRADTGTSTTTNGVNVSQWDNLSFVTGLDAVQAAGASQPVFQDNATNNINFNPTIRFINDHLEIPAPGVFINGTNYEFLSTYVVLKDDDATNFDWVYYEGTSGIDRFSFSWNWAGGANADYDVTTANRLSAPTPSITKPHMFGLHSGVTGVFGAVYDKKQAFDVDGTTLASDNTYGGYTGTNNIFYIGDQETGGDSPNSPFTGNIGEIIIFQDSLPELKQKKVETYLALKYGITITQDYVSNSGTTVYDVSNGYANGILGVAREVSGYFYQPKSKSETDLTDGLTIELTTDISSGVYAICGHDGGGMARVSLAGETSVLTQKWYSDHTGGVGTLNLELDLAEMGLGTTPAANNVKILIANNPAFNNTYVIEATSVAGGIAYFTGIPLYDKYFTFSIP